ncbi:unnamed protein product [Clonostachys solani]|uniref:Alpha/beta hydrolase fold-3 domain-containing protein n=1 Tax=Clonostachys solani TaxID=160281 RepID=A0A9P0EDN6_9HYPO|nr:unnamed protein product [Clonostachys solani]
MGSQNNSEGQAPNPLNPEFLNLLDQDFIDYYNKHLAGMPKTHLLSIEEMRKNGHKYASPWCRDFSNEAFVKDIKLAADDGHVFTARCYYPDKKKSTFGIGPYPVYINFHGGGWTFGGLTGDAEICMAIRDRLGILVMDIDYRLSPENAFGTGADDSWAAVKWVHQNGTEINAQGDCISIGGISAGGHICATLQQLARDADLPLRLAILAVPAVIYEGDFRKPSDAPFQSWVENQNATCLNWERSEFFQQHYNPKNSAERAEFDARPICYKSPLYGELRGLCDTFICTAERDPLRDEGEAYGLKLAQLGVRVTIRRYTNVAHPFMHMAPIKKAQMYLEDICGELGRAISSREA